MGAADYFVLPMNVVDFDGHQNRVNKVLQHFGKARTNRHTHTYFYFPLKINVIFRSASCFCARAAASARPGRASLQRWTGRSWT